MAPTRDTSPPQPDQPEQPGQPEQPEPGQPERASLAGGAAGTPPPAGLGRRLAALVIDWFCCLLLASVFTDPRGSYWPVLLLVAVNTVFIGLFGQTPGMAVARVRCVSYADGGALGLGRALLRALLLVLLIPAVIMDDLRRGLHDRAAGSIVLAAPPRPAGRA